ncbi:MAG: flagellar biosynthesis protein FlhF [Marinobacter sp.]|nr:flagellar biosynthesis protein FlhF [Marinobacter sp.]
MKVKRFFAPTMGEALKTVRSEMGPDAVILSNRRVEGGVEIVTAQNYDENVARQRLGDAAVEATNAARLAELQADQHCRLEDELGRSRDRIRQIREQRAAEGEVVWQTREPELKAVVANDSLTQAALEEMRAEINSLRDLVSTREQAVAAEPVVAKPATGAVQQRLAERLESYGVSGSLAVALASNHQHGRLEEGWKQSLKALAAGLRTRADEWMDVGGIYALAGPTGAGKTTTIGKLAARYVLRHGADSLALVTTDRFRVAAHEQLFVFGRILNVPVRVVDESHSLDSILDELSDKRLVLIDTAGLTPADKGCQQQLEELANSYHDIKPYLVVAATSQPRIMKSTWHCYKMAGLAGCILTKLDEAMTLGEVIGFAVETGLPVAYYTDGQKIPQDLHPAKAAQLVKLGIERMKQWQDAPVSATGT